jgi:hypothetical protein
MMQGLCLAFQQATDIKWPVTDDNNTLLFFSDPVTDDNNTLLFFNDVQSVGWAHEERNTVQIKSYITKPRGTFAAIKETYPSGQTHYKNTVACTPVARQRPRKNRRYNSRDIPTTV